MNKKDIIYGTIVILSIVLIIMIFHKKKENTTSINTDPVNLSEDALKKILSVYTNSSGTASFNNIQVTGKLSTQNLNAKNFNKIIVMWSGQITTIPPGWVLCDGKNGTPDLRGRFVLGSNDNREKTIRIPGTTGGSEKITLEKKHLPPHTHKWGIATSDNDDHHGARRNYTYDKSNEIAETEVQTTASLVQTMQGKDGEKSNFGMTESETSKTGLGQPFDIMPPFYVLAFIMKIDST